MLLLIVVGAAMSIVAVRSFQTDSGAKDSGSKESGAGPAIAEDLPGVKRRTIHDLIKDGPEIKKAVVKKDPKDVPAADGGDGQLGKGTDLRKQGPGKEGPANAGNAHVGKGQAAANVTESVKPAFLDFEKDPSGPGLYYTVRDADTFSEIVARYCGSAAASIQDRIVKLNEGMDISRIRKGDKILFPEDLVKNLSAQRPGTMETGLRAKERGKKVERSGSGSSYVIQDGDTLWDLAVKRVGEKLAVGYITKIRQLNPWLDVTRLGIGKSIVLPD